MGYAFDSLVEGIIGYSMFTFLDHTFTLRDVILFTGIMAATILLMVRIPRMVKKVFMVRIVRRFRREETLKEWDNQDKKQSIDYQRSMIESVSRFLFWSLLLIGFTLACIGSGVDIRATTDYEGFSFSLASFLQFFAIILVTLFLSKIVPVWLVNLLYTFVVNLKIFRALEGKKKLFRDEKRQQDFSQQITLYFTKFLYWSILIVGFAYAIATLGFEPDAEVHLLGADVRVLDVVNSILAGVLTAVFVIYFFPPILDLILSSVVKVYEKRNEKEAVKVSYMKEEIGKIKPGLHRTLFYLILLVGVHIAISYLPKESFFSILSFLSVIVRAMIILAAAFLLTILTPLLIYSLSSSREEIRKSNIYQVGRYITYLILLIALFLIMGVTGLDLDTSMAMGESRITVWGFLTAILVIIITIMASKMIVAMLRDTLLHPDLIDEHASRVLERLTHIIIICIGIAISLGVMGVNILAVATGLGLIGFALAFGMQDTIANFMAGIMIAIERPFKIGDRIRVGDEWGDVIDIGLRSTMIRTVKSETVTIPNNLIATREVWNFTKENPSVIVTVPMGISYDSDWHQAEEIILKAALKHPFILGKPEPHVRMTQFGESSIDLELWAWISHAKYKDIVSSDILKVVKDKFDAEGIEIPYPYRTIVFKKDMDEMRFMDVRHQQLPPGQTQLF